MYKEDMDIEDSTDLDSFLDCFNFWKSRTFDDITKSYNEIKDFGADHNQIISIIDRIILAVRSEYGD